MSLVTIDDSYLTAIGNAIRAKNGSTTTYKPSEMAAAISAIESGDSGLLLSAYWNDTITGAISDDTITKIPSYGFDRSSAVGGDKHEITSVSFPNVLTVGSAAFDYNSTIQTIYLPNATSIEYNVCYHCTALESFIAPKATFKTLKRDPATAGDPTTQTPIAAYQAESFEYCTSLKKIDLYDVDYTFYPRFFDRCNALETVILRKTSGLVGTGYYSYPTLGPNNCYIYVPASLLAEYQASEHWEGKASRLRAIEDYPEITGGAI